MQLHPKYDSSLTPRVDSRDPQTALPIPNEKFDIKTQRYLACLERDEKIQVDNAHVRLAIELTTDEDLLSSIPLVKMPRLKRGGFVRLSTLLFAFLVCVAGAYLGLLVASIL